MQLQASDLHDNIIARYAGSDAKASLGNRPRIIKSWQFMENLDPALTGLDKARKDSKVIRSSLGMESFRSWKHSESSRVWWSTESFPNLLNSQELTKNFRIIRSWQSLESFQDWLITYAANYLAESLSLGADNLTIPVPGHLFVLLSRDRKHEKFRFRFQLLRKTFLENVQLTPFLLKFGLW